MCIRHMCGYLNNVCIVLTRVSVSSLYAKLIKRLHKKSHEINIITQSHETIWYESKI